MAALVVCSFATGVRAENDFVSRAEDLYSRGEYLLIIDYIETTLSDTLGLDREERAGVERRISKLINEYSI